MTFVLDGEPVKTGGPEDRLLPWDRVQDMAGISRTTAWRMQRTGAFPSPVSVSPGRVGWWESELTAWKKARGTAGGHAPPARPRLPGMPRSTSPRPARQPEVLAPPAESSPGAGVASVEIRQKRGRRAATNLDQIDFGF